MNFRHAIYAETFNEGSQITVSTELVKLALLRECHFFGFVFAFLILMVTGIAASVLLSNDMK